MVRNSSVVYHKTHDLFRAKICLNVTFQLLLFIMLVKSEEDQEFCSVKFGNVMWKPPI